MGIRHYMDKIIQKGSDADMDKLGDIFVDMYEHIKDCDVEEAYEIKMDMYEMACGKMLTDEMAHDWVVSMKPYGEHWNKETTTQVLRSQSGVGDIKETDFYVVLNMLYNDNEEKRRMLIPDEEMRTKLYIADAISWLKDVDAINGTEKLYEYWKYIIK